MRLRNIPALGIAVLLVACLTAAFLTRRPPTETTPAANPQKSPVDDRLVQTARQLSAIADSAPEQDLAREALRLSDHELDQAFASALREAAAPAPASGPVKALADRVAQVKSRIAAEQARIAKLTADAAKSDAAGDQLELAKAQLALEQDELEDAQQDLARHGGDQHARIQRAREEHETAQREPARMAKLAQPPATLAERVQLWFGLGDRKDQVEAARQQASGKASALAKQHDALAKVIRESPAPGAFVLPKEGSKDWSVVDDLFGDEEEDTATLIGRMRGLSEKAKSLAELGKRSQDAQALADVYKRWTGVLEARRGGVLHDILGALAVVLGVLLVAVIASQAIRRALEGQTDRRRLSQLRTLATIGVQVAALLVILLIAFGPPNQLSTVIGLATAGLTVALKDFIVAFFGWFALMGRNGIRVGDWVEIEGISGEVIEIGLLRTVLLEMGNWADTGHPTGRRVALMNGYAIEGHYFNFSTAGQWLWDEIQVSLPANGDPHATAQQIREMVDGATGEDAAAAEREWERVTRQYGIRPFSARPAVDLRPSAHGLDVVVRYITRAPQRYAVKSHLFEAIVDLLHRPVEKA